MSYFSCEIGSKEEIRNGKVVLLIRLTVIGKNALAKMVGNYEGI
jgi:hypothetical protein